MRAGEKARFKDAVGGGVVKEVIDDERVLITDDYGFDMTVEVSRLVVVDEVGDELMRTRKVRRKTEPDAGRGGRTCSKAMGAGGGRGAGEVSGSVVAGGSSCVEVDLHSAVLGIDSLSSELQRELQMEYFRRQMAAHAMHKGWKIVNQEVVRQREKPDWNGRYDYDRVDVYDCRADESVEAFDFDTPEQLWEEFQIDGKPLSYILEHSFIWISS